jgi:2-hydroxychromene-2-carboxylate isomerase
MSAADAETLTFYYDFSSPYAYLGATQVERVARDAGAPGVIIRWRPILVGALFNAIGTPNVPLDEFPAAKRSYMLRDLLHWASHWDVPFRFPMRTVAPLRMVYAAEAAGGDVAALTHALFRAYWVDNRDLADPAVLATLGDVAGIDAPAVKAALRAATDEAIAAGVCGVPSFVARGQLFWGQDRLELVSRTLGGWDPPSL